LAVNNNFKEEEEIKQVISDNKIEKNTLDDKDDIKIKIVRVWELTKKHYSLDEDRVAL